MLVTQPKQNQCNEAIEIPASPDLVRIPDDASFSQPPNISEHSKSNLLSHDQADDTENKTTTLSQCANDMESTSLTDHEDTKDKANMSSQCADDTESTSLTEDTEATMSSQCADADAESCSLALLQSKPKRRKFDELLVDDLSTYYKPSCARRNKK